MSATHYPIINADECMVCASCVDFCKQGVFVKGNDGGGRVVAPEKCDGACTGCAIYCPGRAITFSDGK